MPSEDGVIENSSIFKTTHEFDGEIVVYVLIRSWYVCVDTTVGSPSVVTLPTVNWDQFQDLTNIDQSDFC